MMAAISMSFIIVESRFTGEEFNKGALTDVEATLRSENTRIIEIIALLMFFPRWQVDMVEYLCTLIIDLMYVLQLNHRVTVWDYSLLFNIFWMC